MMPSGVVAAVLAALLSVLTGAPARDEIRDAQWHLPYLKIEQAHQISTGDGVIVGVVDTGVDGGHPDLAGALLPGADTSPGGRSDAWEDLDGHGTAMTGLIVANGRALGIAPGATVLPVRKALLSGASIESATVAAIRWAVDNGAAVLCLAFGGRGYPALEQAIADAIANDVVVVAGVGNRPDQGIQYPAGYPGVVGAAGVDHNGNHADISIDSPAAVLAAPAVDIASTGARNVFPTGYRLATGTSGSTAIIAGVAALVRSEFPELSAEEVIHRMTATAIDRGEPGRDREYGYGIVDPVAALTADVPPLEPSPTALPSPSASTGSSAEGGSSGAPVGLIVGAGVAVLVIVGLVLGLRHRSGS